MLDPILEGAVYPEKKKKEKKEEEEEEKLDLNLVVVEISSKHLTGIWL